MPDRRSEYALAALGDVQGLSLVTRAEAEGDRWRRADLVHRPYQVNNEDDLELLTRLGERIVVTNQDLIGYHNPFYFRGFDGWQGYRKNTRAALALADRVIFFSAHACEQAIAEDLIDPSRTSVVHIGVDHTFTAPTSDIIPPRGHAELPADSEAILCIGADFHHKNRVFALSVVDQLQRRHDWQGCLMLVGPTVAQGSSCPQEAEMLAMNPRLAGAVFAFPAVSEAEKSWLYGRSRLVFYPTVHEGFGLVPFEAADSGVPCLWAAGTSLSELLPDAEARIVPWSAEDTADNALALLRDDGARAGNLEAIHQAAAGLTWDTAATNLLAAYKLACDGPVTHSGRLRRERMLDGGLGEDAIRLIGADGVLPPDVVRPLLALATHPRVGTPTFAALRAGYRVSNKLRRLNQSAARRHHGV
jgi:glycosyltransferase involved in cell wall biosynthesis